LSATRERSRKYILRKWLHLNHIRHTVTRRLAAHLERYDLTLAQFGVLAQLQAVPDLSQQALADWLFVTKGNMVGLLKRAAPFALQWPLEV
jgi:DNA-binding MarR family transcriptional regulator